jgi:cytochrome c oxidase assembly protein subunit 15
MADAKLLAAVHGCTAPLFFSLAAALVTLTSPAWRADTRPRRTALADRLQRLTIVLAVLIYAQIVFGAQLRHVRPEQQLFWHTLWVWLHVLNAALLSGFVVAVLRVPDLANESLLRRRGWLAAMLCALQLLLGAGTWITHYGWPAWFRHCVWTIDYTVAAEGPLQTLTTTTHVVAGSLALVTVVSMALWSRRLLTSVGHNLTSATPAGER